MLQNVDLMMNNREINNQYFQILSYSHNIRLLILLFVCLYINIFIFASVGRNAKAKMA
jgi:hypothetical protein